MHVVDDDLLTGGNLFEDTPAVPEPVPEVVPPQPEETMRKLLLNSKLFHHQGNR